MPKHEADAADEEDRPKRAKPTPVGDAETEPDVQLNDTIAAVMITTDMNRDVSLLIAKYTRPYVLECVDPEVKIVEEDIHRSTAEHYITLNASLREHISHGVTQDRTPFDPHSILVLILTYSSAACNDCNNRELNNDVGDTWTYVHYVTRELPEAIRDCGMTVFRNHLYFHDRHERHVIGYVPLGDMAKFQFVGDGSADVFHDLRRRIEHAELDLFHDHSRLYGAPSDSAMSCARTSDTHQWTIVSHPTDTHSDIVLHESVSPNAWLTEEWCNVALLNGAKDQTGFSMINPKTGVKRDITFPDRVETSHRSMVFEPTENRFIRMVLGPDFPARFDEVVVHPEQSIAALKPLVASTGDIPWYAVFWRWWWYRGTLLGYDIDQGKLTIISVSGDIVSVHTFKKPIHERGRHTQFVLCGRWFVEVKHYPTYIGIKRFSLDLRVLT